ncbi:MAG: arsenite transporter [Gammaproteobacteria bacterium]|nr:MAG: arsenite transporter [Pseudomonadota bacterium]PIE38412.1 MAG: arsenite transporter [Gammaproteobacteria bacterium]
MWKLLISINKNLIYAIPVVMIAGFVVGVISGAEKVQWMKQLIIPLTFLMVYPMMVTLNIKNLAKGMNPKLQGITQAINFLVIPFFAWGMGRVFFPNEPYLALGLLLASLLPTSGMTISWTGFAKGNMGAAINMTVIGLTLGSILTPFYVKTLLGAEVEIDFARVLQQIGLIVFLPMAVGFLTRTLLVKNVGMDNFKTNLAPKFPALSTIGVLGIVFVAMTLKAPSVISAPEMLLGIFIPLLILYAANFLLSTLVGRLFFQRGDAIALVYGTVMRNLSIALAIAMNAFGPEGANAALVIALAYIIQVQSAAWYVKFTDRVFGPLPK